MLKTVVEKKNVFFFLTVSAKTKASQNEKKKASSICLHGLETYFMRHNQNSKMANLVVIHFYIINIFNLQNVYFGVPALS